MKTMYLTSLLLLVVACSGGQTTGGATGGESKVQLKKAAADAKASGSAQGDACAEHGWYGDGECDSFCQDVDSVDCTPATGGEVVCTLILESSDGVCGRKREDPCIGQDPDCANVDPGPSDPIVPPMPVPPGLICPAIALKANGVCDADFQKDPCLFYADPDCAGVDPLPNEPPDGAGGTGGSVPSDPGMPSCKIAPEPSDGVCSRAPNDPCVAADPDCPTDSVCAAYIEQSDGECKREPTDPCIFQDPDCRVK
jgi:hypothetical protein